MCRVLILDDDVLHANAIKSIFDNEGGFKPDVCLRSDDAIRFAQKARDEGKPYEILLIDQYLGNEKDGIQTMRELRRISPDSEAVILTGFEDAEDGMQAYKAGAARYMSKPVQRDELLFVVNALVQKRQQEVEQQWRKSFIEMTERALITKEFSDVAEIVLENSMELGFERAHLYWVPRREDSDSSQETLLGINCKGKGCIPNFKDRMFRSDSSGKLAKYLAIHDASLIQSKETEMVLQPMISAGFHAPAGTWALLPLWSRDELLGCLTLDYGNLERNPKPFELNLLDFFARQVSVVLENSSLHIRTERTLQETEIIGEIGRKVSANAATQDPTQLLVEIREQLKQLLDVSNFSIFFHDEETKGIDFALRYENDVRKKGWHRAFRNGLEEYMLAQQQAIYISENVREFSSEKNIKIYGKMPISWLGAPMRVSGKTIGGIVIQKFSGKKIPKTAKRILAAAANQVAGAIQISNYAKEEALDSNRLQLLNSASIELMRLAQENKEHFWLTVLTLATADFGLGFNRALLFLARDNQSCIQGIAGIGTEDHAQAVRDWKRDQARKFDFDKFLKTVGTKRFRLTPFHEEVKKITIQLENNENFNLINATLEGNTIAVPEKEMALNFPTEIKRAFSLSNCVLMPLRASNKVLGLVIVDNKHNHKVIDERSLNRLQLLLDNTGLVWEIVQRGEKTRELLDTTHKITAWVTHQTLSETLAHICKTARFNSEADWTIIYPIRPGKSIHELELDLENYGCDGQLNSPSEKLIATQPRVGGISKLIIQRGSVVIRDIDKENKSVSWLQQLSEHHFIREEGVKAMIGVAVRDPYNNDPLGIFYLDYNKPREISETEIHHAHSFANLAASAIASLRRLDENRQRQLLQATLDISEIVGANIDLDSILAQVLKNLQKLFLHTNLCVLLYDKDDHALKFAPATLKYYTIKNAAYQNQQIFPLDQIEKGSIACKVARTSLDTRQVETHYVPDVTLEPEYLPLNPATRSELCISLMQEGSLLGILALERAQTNFDEDDINLVKTVASELSLAIARAQEREYTLFKSSIAAMTSWASELAHDIRNEIGQIRSLAYLIQTAAPNNHEVHDYALSIEKSAEKLNSVGPWSNSPPKLIPLDHALTTFLSDLARERDLELELDLHLGETPIHAHPQEIRRVLNHLVRNAARAMLNTAEKKIRVSSHLHPTKPAYIEVIFKDYGQGIDESVRGRILQIPTTTKERSKEQGGYGLLFARELIEEMGGSIRLLNPNDITGAAFSIVLPIATTVETENE